MKKMIIGWSIGFAIALLLTVAINPPDEICILMGLVFVDWLVQSLECRAMKPPNDKLKHGGEKP
jgi:hypothetical protein